MFKNSLILFFLLGPYLSLFAQPLPRTAHHSLKVALFNKVNPDSDTYAPFRYGDKVYFSTDYRNVRHRFVKGVFGTSGGGEEATLLAINSSAQDLHTANLTLSPDGKTMFYTLCQDDGQVGCTIWSRKKSYDGKWEAALKLPPHINRHNTTSTQPAVGYDWAAKKYLLYFASDRPGGKGGMDLWYCTIEPDGSYGWPEPVPFNTEMDDITPFFHLSERTLFFSSNGRGGFGGFDIFSCQISNSGEWSLPVNQGGLINSAYDESYFTFHTNAQKGYFASNRPLSVFENKETSQSGFKVFEIDPLIELTLPVFDASNLEGLYNTSAHVYDEMTGQKIVFNEQPFDRNLTVMLLPGRSYKIVVIKDGYLPAVVETNTEGVIFPITLTNDVHLFVDEALPYSNRETFGTAVKFFDDEEPGSIEPETGSNQ